MGRLFQQVSERTIRITRSFRKRARQGFPVFALFLLNLVFFSDILRSGGLFIERDLTSFFIPPRHFWVDCLKGGDFPLWNPLNFGGHPFLATLQPGVLYPPNLLFFILPFSDAFNWIIISHFFLAGAFTYAFLRFLEAGRAASFLGASLFLLGGYLLSLHSLLSALLSLIWLPLILLLFGRALRFNSLWSAVWAGVFLSVSFLGGGVETVMATCGTLGLMAVYSRSFGGNVRFALKALMVTAAVFAGMSAIQMVPFLELSNQSIRKDGLSYQEAIVWSASPLDLISFLIHDPYGSLTDIKKYWIRQSWLKTFYVGGIPFLLSIIYILKEKKGKYFWLLVGAFSIFFALGGFNPLYPYMYKFIPGVNKIRYTVKFLFLGMFALCVMTGLGLQRLLDVVRQEGKTKIGWAAIILATSTAIFLLWLNVQHEWVLAYMKSVGLDKPTYNDAAVNLYNLKRMLFYFTLGCSIIWLLIKTRGSRYGIVALCLVMVLDLLGNIGYYASTMPDVYFADNWTVRQVKSGLGEYRTLITPFTYAPTSTIMAPNILPGALSQRVISPSFNLNYGIRDIWGAEVMRVKRTDDLYNVMIVAPSIDATRIVDLFSVKYVISTKPISSPNFAFVGADIEGLEGDRKKLLKDQTIKLYRNKRVLPRSFIATGYRVEADPSAALKLLSKKAFDPGKTVLLEEPPIWDPAIPSVAIPKGPAGASILSESNNKVELHARVMSPSLLYLADTWYPGWTAYVDGKKTKIYRANYNFRAVPLPPGEHTVVFRYEPLSFYIGACITGVTLLILIVCGLTSFLRRRNKGQLIADDNTTIAV